MKIPDLIFVGIKGSVVALKRDTGQQVWATRLKGWDYVNVLLENGLLLATCSGEIFCLDPLKGTTLWHNPLKGYGTGLAAIATQTSHTAGNPVLMAEKRWQDQRASS